MRISSGWLPAVVVSCVLAAPAHAHNARVHRDMTDRAYHIMLALSENRLDIGTDAGLRELATAARGAIRKLQGLPAGLPAPKDSRCADPDTIKKLGTNTPNWGAPASFAAMPLGLVRYPIKTSYITGTDCGVDPDWSPGAFFDTINVSALGPRDHTGVVLGFWAHQPDDEVDDWHIFGRLSNVAGFSVVKDYVETAAGAGAGTVWVTVKCALECVGDVLGLGGDCKDCLDDAIDEAKTAVHDGLATVDNLVPGIGDHTSLDLYTGMGHHVNVGPGGPPTPWKVGPDAYDDHPGLLIENAGPIGIPDAVEFLAMGGAEGPGLTVHYNPSLGPKRYEVQNALDFQPDSKHRGENDWEWMSFPHTPFTPLDNLAWYGWHTFRDAPASQVPALGWALHGFGDGIVPMHVVGTAGWGHRPYEDAFENKISDYLYADDRQGAQRQALSIARRAVAWRRVVLDWRARHPQRGFDIPVRDLVTALAKWTYDRISGPGMLLWPFNPSMSGLYVVPGLHKESSILYYENAPGADATNEDLLEEGIAAELAFLVSINETLP